MICSFQYKIIFNLTALKSNPALIRYDVKQKCTEFFILSPFSVTSALKEIKLFVCLPSLLRRTSPEIICAPSSKILCLNNDWYGFCNSRFLFKYFQRYWADHDRFCEWNFLTDGRHCHDFIHFYRVSGNCCKFYCNNCVSKW